MNYCIFVLLFIVIYLEYGSLDFALYGDGTTRKDFFLYNDE